MLTFINCRPELTAYLFTPDAGCDFPSLAANKMNMSRLLSARGCSAAIVALSSSLLLHAQVWEVFDVTTAGFPTNGVSSLAEDDAGHIWVGTNFGLCRYDGASWEVYQTGNSDLPGDVVTALAVDTADRLWVGTQLNGIGVFDGLGWEYYDPTNSPLPDYEIKSLTIDHRNWAWIGTYLGVVCFTGSEWRIYNDSDTSYAGLALHGNVIEDVQVRTDGLVAIGTQNGGFHYLTDTSVMFLTSYDDNFPDNTQNAIVFDQVNNERWLATPAQGLLRQGGAWWNGPWFQYTTFNSNIPSNAITCLTRDSDGSLWFGTLVAGLGRRYTNGTFGNYTMGNSGLPDDAVEAVLVAGDGSLWVGTGFGGAARLSFPSSMDEEIEAAIHVYPVPTSGPVTVTFAGSLDPTPWSLFDPAGRSMRQGVFRDASNALDLSDLGSGVYMLSIARGERVQIKRIQVLR